MLQAQLLPDNERRKKTLEYKRKYRIENREKVLEAARKYRLANLDRERERNRQYAAANKEKRATYQKQYRKNNAKYNAWQRNNGQEKRAIVLEHYGGKCECCGETNPLFLNIDHVNNDGNKRRHEGRGGRQLYLWIIRNNFPSDFRILCFNCNCGRQLNNGICPHKTDPL